MEQVIAAAPQIAALLDGTQVCILATSREALQIYGEYEFPLTALALPNLHDLPPLAPLAAVPAVALFVERARAARYDFTLTADTAPAVAAICVRLDGIPLAIELAAARTKLFSPPAMLARLDQRLPLLTGGPRDLPRHQQTLRDTLDWSYDLLTPAEQARFRRVSVFVGGWTLAVETVCYDPAEAADDMLAELTALVAKNLISQEPDALGEPRFGLLEPIREYALTQMAAHYEAADLHHCHSA